MGPSGSGKSLVGALLAERLGVPFVDADSLHPASNVAKMAAGIPLDDADRWPWLDAVGAAMSAQSAGIVAACSALRRAYRDRLLRTEPRAVFVELLVDRATLADRMSARAHFMPASLLDSQLRAFEPLASDEPGFAVRNEGDLDALLNEIVQGLRSRPDSDVPGDQSLR
ncbi:gluconokinase [uncultured Microbacterium sp.]|uniref:gluconokinase n=1 Tax=uncultured Microbacterium sp. TaxID=191216 RepID=UPI0035CB13E1